MAVEEIFDKSVIHVEFLCIKVEQLGHVITDVERLVRIFVEKEFIVAIAGSDDVSLRIQFLDIDAGTGNRRATTYICRW